MSGLNVALYSSQSALLANQKKMNITANNLSNMDKAGYHRQTATLTNNAPLDTTYGQIGTGSHVSQIVRAYDSSLENSLRQSTSGEGNAEIYADQLYYLEGAIAPSGDSVLTEAVSNFADALQHVATRPEADDARLDLLSKSEALATQFNETHSQVTTLRDGIADASGNGTLSDRVDEVNRILTEIDEVNTQIVKAESRLFSPAEANDLRDHRDQLVLDLAKLTDLSITETSSHAYTITIGGHTALDGSTGAVDSLSITMGPDPQLNWANGGTPTAAVISDGEIQGLTRAWNYLDGKATDLWTYATNLTSAVNTQHALGFDPSGTAGGALFDAGTAGAMTVSITDPALIAASDSATESGSGDNMLTTWSTLKNNDLIFESEKYVNTIASDTASARAAADTAEAGRLMFTNAVASVSAVSIDEEMITMLNVQRAFQASSRVVSTVGEMLDTALSMV